MTSQDLYRHPETLSSPEFQLNSISGNSFFLNSPDIITADHVVRISKTYLLFDFVEGKLSSAKPVVLKRVLDTNDGVHVSLVDMITQTVLVRKLAIGGSTLKRQWKLVDLDLLINSNNLDVIEDATAGNEGELLEFCFLMTGYE